MASILKFGDHVVGVTQIAQVHIPEESTAADANEWAVLEADADITIEKVVWVPAAAVSGAATNNFALNARNRGTDGTGTTDVTDEKTYDSGTDSVAFQPEDLSLSGTAADLDVDAGEVVTFERTVNGTGLASPDGVLQVHYTYR